MESLYKDMFSSLDDAHQACNQVARNKGFALVIRTKKPNAKEPRYMHLRCSQGGKKATTTTANDDDGFYDKDRDKNADKRRRK